MYKQPNNLLFLLSDSCRPMTLNKNTFVTIATVVCLIQFSFDNINNSVIQLDIFSDGNNSAFQKILETCFKTRSLKRFTDFFFGDVNLENVSL